MHQRLTPLANLAATSTAILGALCVTSCGDPAQEATPRPGQPEASRPDSEHLQAEGDRAPAPEGRPGEPEVPTSPGRTRLIESARERGLVYTNHSGEAEKAVVLEANGAGVALLDLGADGDLDVVFAQGLPRLADLVAGPGADLEVFINLGAGRFERAPGPGLSGWWNGLATGDVDSDGDCDLVAGGFGGLVVVLQDLQGNLGPGPDLLADLPPESAAGARLVPGEPREAGACPWWVTSLGLLDADGDGHLDLYVGRYLDLDPLDPPLGSLGEGALAVPCRWKGHEVFCGPHGLPPQSDRLLRGRGDGTFEDRTAAWLPDHQAGYTLGLASYDFDGDRDTDLYVANDSVPNLLLINDGSGRLTDVGYSAGVAVSIDGASLAGMGVAVGDVNADGRPDLAVTNFSGEPTQLWFGAEFGFQNQTHRMGLLRETRALLSWGTHLEDFDGDGLLELFTANGHVYPQADRPDTGTTYGQADTLWVLDPAGAARRVEPSGPESVLAPASGTRGSAVGDLDGDGAPDLVLNRIDGPAALGLNRSTTGAGRLVVRCIGAGPRAGVRAPETPGTGRRSPLDGHGARLTLVLDESTRRVREVQTAVGYQSASDGALYFGLGARERYLDLVVEWPSGLTENLGPGVRDRHLTLAEGRGIVAQEELR